MIAVTVPIVAANIANAVVRSDNHKGICNILSNLCSTSTTIDTVNRYVIPTITPSEPSFHSP